MSIKVYAGELAKLRQPFLKLEEEVEGVYLVVVDEQGDHVTNLLELTDSGCHTFAGALEDLVEGGFDLSGMSFDRFGSLLINEKEV